MELGSLVRFKKFTMKAIFYIHTLFSEITRRIYNVLGRESKSSRMVIFFVLVQFLQQ